MYAPRGWALKTTGARQELLGKPVLTREPGLIQAAETKPADANAKRRRNQPRPGPCAQVNSFRTQNRCRPGALTGRILHSAFCTLHSAFYRGGAEGGVHSALRIRTLLCLGQAQASLQIAVNTLQSAPSFCSQNSLCAGIMALSSKSHRSTLPGRPRPLQQPETSIELRWSLH